MPFPTFPAPQGFGLRSYVVLFRERPRLQYFSYFYRIAEIYFLQLYIYRSGILCDTQLTAAIKFSLAGTSYGVSPLQLLYHVVPFMSIYLRHCFGVVIPNHVPDRHSLATLGLHLPRKLKREEVC